MAKCQEFQFRKDYPIESNSYLFYPELLLSKITVTHNIYLFNIHGCVTFIFGEYLPTKFPTNTHNVVIPDVHTYLFSHAISTARMEQESFG